MSSAVLRYRVAGSPGAIFANVTKTSTCCLMTPAIAPASMLSHERRAPEDKMDPFEPFGRVLARYLSTSIRHVPFMPATGFTPTHAQLAGASEAIVVVVCEPEQDKAPSLCRQAEFARDAALQAAEAKIPIVWLAFGDLQDFWPISTTPAHGIKCDRFDAELMGSVVESVLGRSPAVMEKQIFS